MPDRNIKAVVAYDGSGFLGWQNQRSGRSVQGVIEEALADLHGHPVAVCAAGRTDSGVHAEGQVINFFSTVDSMSPDRFTPALNTRLPFDVRVLASREAADSFNARRDARVRIYDYYLFPRPIVLPHLRPYCHWLRRAPRIARLNSLAAVLIGSHDFTSFAALNDINTNKVRTVYSAAFFPRERFIVFRIAASAFLWKMVRTIVGTLLELEEGGGGREDVRAILDARDRRRAGETAPASGLFLHRVIYDDDEPICSG